MHNEISVHTKEIHQISIRLDNFAAAFSMTGNAELANNLWSLAEQLEVSQKAIQKAVSKEIQDRCKESEQASTNMLNACLAGIIGKE